MPSLLKIFCATAAPPRRNLICPAPEVSNIGVMGFIDADVTIPTVADAEGNLVPGFASADDAVTFFKAQALLCKCRILQNIQGSKPLGAPVTSGRNYANSVNPKEVSKDHTLSGFDRDHLYNTGWWNAMVADASDQNFFYVTNERIYIIIDKEATVEFGVVITETGKDEVDGPFNLKWNQVGEPVGVKLIGIRTKLNRLFVFTFTSTPITYVETAGEVFTIASTTAGGTISFTVVETTSAPLVWTMSGTTIPGLSINSATGVISGTPTTPGTYTRDVTATNPCGIYGITRIKIVVT